MSGGQVYGECHDGAVYLHRGRQYLIAGRDAAKGHIHAEAVEVPYYTRTKTEKETEILDTLRSRPMPGFWPSWAVSRCARRWWATRRFGHATAPC